MRRNGSGKRKNRETRLRRGMGKWNKALSAVLLGAILTACVKTEETDTVMNLQAETRAENEAGIVQNGEDRQNANTVQDPADRADMREGNDVKIQRPTTDTIEAEPEREREEADFEEEPEITLIMTGDILLHTPVAESGLQEDGSYDFSAVFAHTKEQIGEADLALVNQEVILGGTELGISGYPAFNAPYELGDALADAGFDVILHATNHALDKGAKGITNCLGFWEESHPDIAALGIHDSREEREEIYVYEQDGMKIAILNYTYGTNGIPMPAGMDYAVDILDEKRMKSDLERAEELADFTIVCPHWGTEYRLTPDAYQERTVKILWENGADLVLGTHPHVIEPIVWFGKDGATVCDLEERDGILLGTDTGEGMLVYYSLGNFVNWTSGTGEGVANRMVGGMAKITLGRNEKNEVYIKQYGVVPVICHVEEGINGVTVYPAADYTETLAEKNAVRKQDGNFSLQYCRALLEQVW